MQVLLTGASGFIGSHVLSALLGAGHGVLAAVRRPGELKRRFPEVQVVACDFNCDTSVEDWLPRLAGIDAVINCAGVLQGGRGQDINAIHVAAPLALFKACAKAGIKRVIHISAVSADATVGTEYASSKKLAEDNLRESGLDWVVLRPSLVYATGSYGGTSLLRGLAALPWRVPVVGGGEQPFRPIYVADLSAGIVSLLDRPEIVHATLEPGGPEVITMKQLVVAKRAWLGLAPARVLHIPMWAARFFARSGGILGLGAMNITALRQLEYGNAGDPLAWEQATGVPAASLAHVLQRQPAHVQDRWHARLYFLRPLARLSLAALWILSGTLALTVGREAALDLLENAGISGLYGVAALFGSCLLDVLIGLALVATPWIRGLGLLQLAVVATYTLFLTIVVPQLWVDPLGPLLKNLPVVLLVLFWMAVEDER